MICFSSFAVDLLARAVPAAAAAAPYFDVAVSRAQHVLGFQQPPAEAFKESRAIRRRIAREEKRNTKTKQSRRRGTEEENRAFSSFLSFGHFLSAASGEGARNRPLEELAVPPGPSSSATPPSSSTSIFKHLLQQYVFLTPKRAISYVCNLLPYTRKLGAVRVTIVKSFFFNTPSTLAPAPSRLNGAVHQGGGSAKRKTEEDQQSRGSKRRHPQGNNNRKNPGDSDEQKREESNKGAHGGEEEEAPSGRLWACPFYKFDPRRHYNCVEKHKLKKFAHVKQHVSRKHILKSNYYCMACNSQWENDQWEQWNVHIRSPDCQGKLRFNPDDSPLHHSCPPGYDRLNSMPRGSSTEKWYWMWDQLFPEYQHLRPESPFVESGIAEPVSLFAQHLRSVLHLALPSLLMLYTRDIGLLESNIVSTILNDFPAAPRHFFRSIPHQNTGPDTDGAGGTEPAPPQPMLHPGFGDQTISNDVHAQALFGEPSAVGVDQTPGEAQHYDNDPSPHLVFDAHGPTSSELILNSMGPELFTVQELMNLAPPSDVLDSLGGDPGAIFPGAVSGVTEDPNSVSAPLSPSFWLNLDENGAENDQAARNNLN